jgi:hypothetical protein
MSDERAIEPSEPSEPNDANDANDPNVPATELSTAHAAHAPGAEEVPAAAPPAVEAQPSPPAPAAAPATAEGPDPFALALAPRPPDNRPLVGAALTVGGVLLWSYVVMGTYTTSWLAGGSAPLAQGTAVTLVTTMTIAAWAVAVRRSRPTSDPMGRSPVASVMVASLVGKASGANVDALVAVALLVVSVVAVTAGDRMLGRTRLPASAGARALVLLAWFGVGLVTLGACVELVAES